MQDPGGASRGLRVLTPDVKEGDVFLSPTPGFPHQYSGGAQDGGGGGTPCEIMDPLMNIQTIWLLFVREGHGAMVRG